MNPIKHFESSIERIQRADVTPDSKRRYLLDVSRAIDHYVQRVERSAKDCADPGVAQQVERAKLYLDKLSSDARNLAKACLPPTN